MGQLRLGAWLVVACVLAIAANIWLIRYFSDDGSDTHAVQQAQDSIASLNETLSARQDTLDALRAVQSAARSESDAVSAQVEESQAEDVDVVEFEEAKIDSLAAVIQHLLGDSTTAADAVVRLVESHDRAMLRMGSSLEAERRNSQALLFRAQTAEAVVAQHDSVDVIQVALLATYAALDVERARQVRQLRRARNGAIVTTMVALVCLVAC